MSAGLNGRAYMLAAWAGIAVLGGWIPILALLGHWPGALAVIPFLAAAVGFVLYEPRLPIMFDALFAWAAVINAAGYAWDLYPTLASYDGFVHLCTTFAVTLTFGYLAYDSVRSAFHDHPWLFLVAIGSFGLGTGAIWEIFEWGVGVIGPVDDTIGDLLLDALGAVAAALLCVRARFFTASPPSAQAASWPTSTCLDDRYPVPANQDGQGRMRR
jgi:hypothetical protein